MSRIWLACRVLMPWHKIDVSTSIAAMCLNRVLFSNVGVGKTPASAMPYPDPSIIVREKNTLNSPLKESCSQLLARQSRRSVTQWFAACHCLFRIGLDTKLEHAKLSYTRQSWCQQKVCGKRFHLAN